MNHQSYSIIIIIIITLGPTNTLGLQTTEQSRPQPISSRLAMSTIFDTPFPISLKLGSTHTGSHCGTVLLRSKEEMVLSSYV